MNGGLFLLLLDHERRRRERLKGDSFDDALDRQSEDELSDDLEFKMWLWAIGVGVIIAFFLIRAVTA